jgi:hypothetical protein
MATEKELKIQGRVAIKKYGVEKFNKTCSDIVLKYTKEWKDYLKRVGRWINFDDVYKTMDKKYMESTMWAFKKLYQKGLIKEEEIKKIFDKKIGEDMIKKLRELSLKFGNIVSSSNLYKLLQIEKDLNTNNVEIKKTILIAGLIRIIEE